MSTPENLLFKVDLKKIDAFLEKHTKSSKCPFCEQSDWTVPTAGEISTCALPWGKIDGNMFAVGLPILPLVCKTCFFVRAMSLHDQGVRDAIEDKTDAQ